MSFARTAAVPAVLAGIAVMGIVANTLLVRAAVRNDGFASDPGYYERAIDWDAQMLARADAQRLGVTVTIELARQHADETRLCARLESADGRAVTGAVVTAAASANLCPHRRIEAPLVPTENGYCVSIADACAGIWRVDVRARIGDVTIADALRTELGAAP